MEKLKVGDLFVVNNSELKYVDLTDNGSFIVKSINTLSEYDYPLTTLLCMYLGDNICEEYYSHIKMQVNNPINDKDYYVSIYDKHNSFRSFDNFVDKGKNFNELEKFILNYPLVVEPIIIRDIKHYYVCENSNKDNTIDLMTKLNDMAKIKYLEAKSDYISSQYEKAFVEDMCISFQKRRIK